MVTGFETKTHPLTPFERKVILPYMVYRLSKNKGHKYIVNASTIIKKVNEYLEKRKYYRDKKRTKFMKLSGPRFRQIIHYIRVNSLVPNLIATSKGYWITTSQEEYNNYLQSLKERANSFNEVFRAMKNYNLTNPLK